MGGNGSIEDGDFVHYRAEFFTLESDVLGVDGGLPGWIIEGR